MNKRPRALDLQLVPPTIVVFVHKNNMYILSPSHTRISATSMLAELKTDSIGTIPGEKNAIKHDKEG